MGRKKKSDGAVGSTSEKMYFTADTEQAIIDYNLSTDPLEREFLYRSRIAKPFDKLAENVINRFKFPYINQTFDGLKRDVTAFLIMNLHKYKQLNGKAFSYFSVCAKNHLIHQNDKAYKETKRSVYFGEGDDVISIDEIAGIEAPNERDNDDAKEFVMLMVKYWDGNITKHFKKRRDIDVANAVIDLFKRVDTIENFNRKALYLMIREMTDCKTSYITKIVNKMRETTLEHLKEYYADGTVGEG